MHGYSTSAGILGKLGLVEAARYEEVANILVNQCKIVNPVADTPPAPVLQEPHNWDT